MPDEPTPEDRSWLDVQAVMHQLSASIRVLGELRDARPQSHAWDALSVIRLQAELIEQYMEGLWHLDTSHRIAYAEKILAEVRGEREGHEP